jgi:stearoyl-CoA desaturase (delta-9 desaturase)
MNQPANVRGKLLWLNTIFLLLTPLAAIIGVIWYFTTQPFSWTPIIACILLHIVTGMGITAGYHRLFSHRTYKANNAVKFVFSIIGAASWQNSAIEWSSDHRRHHRMVDTDNDPYNAKRGFWWSHMLWVMHEGRYHNDLGNVKDLLKDPILSWQHRNYWTLSILFNVGVPVLLGWLTNDMMGMILWAGLVRIVTGHHSTFLINSWAHIFGSQPYSNQNTARDSWWLAFFTYGEGYHNYHHAFETDFRNGRLWYHWDPGKWLISTLAWLGMASDLRRIPDHMVLRRRFEENRSRFSEQLSTWGQAWESWKEDVSERANETHSAMAVHLVRAEASIENALADLRAKQSTWQAAIKNQDLTKDQIRALRRTMRNTRKSIYLAITEWEQMMDQYTMTMAPA